MSCWGSEEVRISCTSMAGAPAAPLSNARIGWWEHLQEPPILGGKNHDVLVTSMSRRFPLKYLKTIDLVSWLELMNINHISCPSFMVIPSYPPKWSPNPRVSHWFSLRQWVDHGVDPASCDLRRASRGGGKSVADWDLQRWSRRGFHGGSPK